MKWLSRSAAIERTAAKCAGRSAFGRVSQPVTSAGENPPCRDAQTPHASERVDQHAGRARQDRDTSTPSIIDISAPHRGRVCSRAPAAGSPCRARRRPHEAHAILVPTSGDRAADAADAHSASPKDTDVCGRACPRRGGGGGPSSPAARGQVTRVPSKPPPANAPSPP